jgi:hypothetical protein
MISNPRSRGHVVSSVSIISIVLSIAFRSLQSALNVPTFHLDGAFQTASGLFRLDSGQFPGRDFFPYLGIGPLLLIFPLFKSAGGTLCASVFSSYFVCLILGWLAISVLVHLIFRPKSLVNSFLTGGVAFFGVNLVARRYSLPEEFLYWNEPGNSLRNVRSSIPYVVALSTFLIVRYSKHSQRRGVYLGVIAGGSLVWTNDFAIPTAGLLIVFSVVFLFVDKQCEWKKSEAKFAAAFLVTWLLVILLISMGHPLGLIEYNYVSVAKDQWWYFAPYAEKSRIFEVNQLFASVSQGNQMPLFVLLGSVGYGFKTKRIEHYLLALIGLILFCGGSLATVGGHIDGYFGGFYYWATMTGILAVARVVQLLWRKRFVKSTKISVQQLFLVPCSLFLVASCLGEINDYKDARFALENDSNKYFVPEFGGYLGKEWKSYVDYARQYKEQTVIEEYWGLWGAFNRNTSPWQVDSAIHALGSVRSSAQSSISNAELVVTTRYTYNQQWQPWSVSQNFWLYEDLLVYWVPDFVSPSTVVWRKTGQSREEAAVDCRVTKDRQSYVLESLDVGFYKVTLDYSTSGGRYLLMVQNNMSYGSDAGGFVSLPPEDSVQTMPVLITRDSGNAFVGKIVGSESATFSINSCAAKKITFSDSEILYNHSP